MLGGLVPIFWEGKLSFEAGGTVDPQAARDMGPYLLSLSHFLGERGRGSAPASVPGMGGVGRALALNPSSPVVQCVFCHLADCGRALS